MNKPYKKSRELGRKPIEENIDPIETTPPNDNLKELMEGDVERVDLEGKIFSLMGYSGSAKQMMVVKSDLWGQIQEAERVSGKKVVTLFILNDGSLELLLEE